MHMDTEESSEILVYRPPADRICLDEIKKSVHMSEYDAAIAACRSNHDDIFVDQKVMNQLRDFVSSIARMYR